MRFFLTHHLVKHYTVFRQLLAHLKIQNHRTIFEKAYRTKVNIICLLCYLKELELRLLSEHLGVVGVKPDQLPLNVRQGTFLHDTLGDVLVRAEVVPPMHLNTTTDKMLMNLRTN